MTEMFGVLAQIRAERLRQDEQWGGSDHDNGHRSEMWDGLIWKFFRLAVSTLDRGYTSETLSQRRRRLVQVAALAVAAIEALDRKSAGSPS